MGFFGGLAFSLGGEVWRRVFCFVSFFCVCVRIFWGFFWFGLGCFMGGGLIVVSFFFLFLGGSSLEEVVFAVVCLGCVIFVVVFVFCS